jgi:nicotinate-nucleotide--dimethylbenzimidazole phosphoribosyltransferase
MEATAGGCDLLVVNGLAAGQDVSVGAIAGLLLDHRPTGPGAELIELAMALHRDAGQNPLELLRRVGGRETAACMGAIMAARLQRVPVILDGTVAASAALVLERLRPGASGHCVLAAPDGMPAGAALERALNLPTLLGIGGHQNDGTAGALAAGLVASACRVFDQAEVGSA